MPLLEVSHNVREPESSGRKRSHQEFSAESGKVDPAEDVKNILPVNIQEPDDSVAKLDISGTSTPGSDSKPATDMNPPPKRKRLTGAEKEARDKELAEKKEVREKELAEKKKEREEKAAAQAAEKAKKEEEKAARAKEKEEKRKVKEEEERVKADKKRKKEEELERKARSQKTLGSFFKIPNTPKKTEGEDVAKENSPAKANLSVVEKQTVSEYSKMFKPFFVKDNTQLAPMASQMDETTRETKSKMLDDYIASQSSENAPPKFDPLEAFSFSSLPAPRGKLHQPVRHLMETAYKASQNAGKTGSADSSKILTEFQTGLSKIPMKVIAFSQDVRPPYYGTVTFKPFALGKGNMQKLARRSMGRRLPLDYDYDSEAEWQDEEEGEDLDLEDEEEELDDEDDMDGFLDDSEDVGLSRRVFADTMKPDITGPCGAAGSTSAPGKLVKPELLNEIKKAILDNKALSKVGIVDFIFHQFKDSASRLEVKNTIEHVAEKKGTGRTKEWELKPGHEITL
ncbi:uncharacterized protein TRIVIDRAFT_188521 [Trichoderma virens Gv29-8]|uniref:Chromatin assembly factor 1 subunit A n=1 Tax=Hypocrea virens (strain Gv29-8 / FGSC 10586) TaxID=413071 RepID=G9MHF1_HYPVG|nr:uncharacterized protein TRIVIDRAFT_188521 [Trichoderma virens Gv29-8]EHK26139.1 hypothetical protein TRIVIDRAFT_188521 [Trichoderma virens Gv29-8]